MFCQTSGRFYQRVGYLLHLNLAGKRLVGFEITPYLIRPRGLEALKGEMLAMVLKDLGDTSRRLADPRDVLDAWDAFLDHMGGPTGLVELLGSHVETYGRDPSRGASLLWNLFHTPAHREFFLRGLDRAARPGPERRPQWAKDVVAKWMDLTYVDVVGSED